MRIKNKEIRQRRHRKEQVIKAAQRELRAKYAGKPAAAEKPAKAKTAAEKPKKAPAKKKTEEPTAE